MVFHRPKTGSLLLLKPPAEVRTYYTLSSPTPCWPSMLALAAGPHHCWPPHTKQVSPVRFVTQWQRHQYRIGKSTGPVDTGSIRDGDCRWEQRLAFTLELLDADRWRKQCCMWVLTDMIVSHNNFYLHSPSLYIFCVWSERELKWPQERVHPSPSPDSLFKADCQSCWGPCSVESQHPKWRQSVFLVRVLYPVVELYQSPGIIAYTFCLQGCKVASLTLSAWVVFRTLWVMAASFGGWGQRADMWGCRSYLLGSPCKTKLVYPSIILVLVYFSCLDWWRLMNNIDEPTTIKTYLSFLHFQTIIIEVWKIKIQ
jgi:hypothetical protein